AAHAYGNAAGPCSENSAQPQSSQGARPFARRQGPGPSENLAKELQGCAARVFRTVENVGRDGPQSLRQPGPRSRDSRRSRQSFDFREARRGPLAEKRLRGTLAEPPLEEDVGNFLEILRQRTRSLRLSQRPVNEACRGLFFRRQGLPSRHHR